MADLHPINLSNYPVFSRLERAKHFVANFKNASTKRMLFVALAMSVPFFVCAISMAISVQPSAVVLPIAASLGIGILFIKLADDHYPEFLVVPASESIADTIAKFVIGVLGTLVLIPLELIKVARGNHRRLPEESPLRDTRHYIIEQTRELVESWNKQLIVFQDIELLAKHDIGDARAVIYELDARLLADRVVVDRRLAFMEELFEKRPLGTVTEDVNIDETILRLEDAKSDLDAHHDDLKARIAAARELSSYRSR